MSASPEAPHGLLADYIPEHDLAVDLDCCDRTIVRWRERGIGPAYTRLNGRIFYRRQAVAEWLQSLETKTPSHRGRRAA
jgi:hypothetical protein